MRGWFGLVARVVTGGAWVVAGALKLPDPVGSVRAVRAYELLPEAVVPTVDGESAGKTPQESAQAVLDAVG